MAPYGTAAWFLEQEARALLTRLDHVRPYSLTMPMVVAATVSAPALGAMERHMLERRQHLRQLVHAFIAWLRSPQGRAASPPEAQRRFTVLRLRFNNVLTQFDIFADVLVQRSEHETGVWISGLDELAADALRLPGLYHAPPVVCYLDRGHGASIRRARTRLPGGDPNPVAIIQVPRERLVGSGIASSLVHEVGHQVAALLDLVPSLTAELARVAQAERGRDEQCWQLLARWISEIVSDFWSVAKVGVTSTVGLLGVVSLPRAFVFRLDAEDPHPTPWIRVKLSCAIGRRLYPDPQWDVVERVWDSFYPVDRVTPTVRDPLLALIGCLPRLADLLANHRSEKTRGHTLGSIATDAVMTPEGLRTLSARAVSRPRLLDQMRPTLAVAVLGQGRFANLQTPEREAQLLRRLLARWATLSALNVRGVTEPGQQQQLYPAA